LRLSGYRVTAAAALTHPLLGGRQGYPYAYG